MDDRCIRFCRFMGAMMLSLTMTSCTLLYHPERRMAAPQGTGGRFRAGQIISLKSSKAISFDTLIERLGAADVIFIGEVHSNPDHHLIQTQLLLALFSRYDISAVGMEYFPKNKQAVLESYLQDQISEEVFLEKTAWPTVWGFDYRFYRPLLLLIKEKQVQALAINAPRRIVKQVARRGLDSLTPGERRQLASDIDLGNQAHRAHLRKVYAEHSHGRLQNFDFFYQAQCVWEDTMAENTAEYLKKGGSPMIVLTGNGHIRNYFGIPDRVLKRVAVKAVTMMPLAWNGGPVPDPGTADYIWLTGNSAGRPDKMGRQSEQTE